MCMDAIARCNGRMPPRKVVEITIDEAAKLRRLRRRRRTERNQDERDQRDGTKGRWHKPKGGPAQSHSFDCNRLGELITVENNSRKPSLIGRGTKPSSRRALPLSPRYVTPAEARRTSG